MSGRYHGREVPTTPRPHLALIEERIASQHRDIQTLRFDNQRLAATHVALNQELAQSQHDLRRLSSAATEVKAERDAQVREVYEKSLRMEAEVRLIGAMSDELAHVRVDARNLDTVKRELDTELRMIDGELERVRSDLQQLPEIQDEIRNMNQELKKGRAAIEFEKETCASNRQHRQAMERNMDVIAREIDKLREELANIERRAMVAAAAANPNPEYVDPEYVAGYGNPVMAYRGNPYIDPYVNVMHQVQVGVEVVPQYGSGAVMNGPYGIQQHNLHG